MPKDGETKQPLPSTGEIIQPGSRRGSDLLGRNPAAYYQECERDSGRIALETEGLVRPTGIEPVTS